MERRRHTDDNMLVLLASWNGWEGITEGETWGEEGKENGAQDGMKESKKKQWLKNRNS